MIIYKEKRDCCGCTACMNICPKNAISMVEDEEGFVYPQINELECIKCGKCKGTCAFQNGYNIDERLENPIFYAAKSKSDEIKINSSSGGMFTEISDYILNNKGIIYGVTHDDKKRAVHIRAETKQERNKCRGSKYSQSSLNNIFLKVKEDLKCGRLVLFTGTPCQVAGLNKFLEDINKENLVMVDIICHGVPSPKLFQEYINFCEELNKSKIENYYHRSKDDGWLHNVEKIVYMNGKEDKKSALSQAWRDIYFSNLASRKSCYNCKYTNIQRPSDITIADFWGIENIKPDFFDNKGVSLLIINTEKGNQIFSRINKNIEFIETNFKDAMVKNPQLHTPVKEDKEREKFWSLYKDKGFKGIIKKYGRYSIKNKIKQNIKKVLKFIGVWN